MHIWILVVWMALIFLGCDSESSGNGVIPHTQLISLIKPENRSVIDSPNLTFEWSIDVDPSSERVAVMLSKVPLTVTILPTAITFSPVQQIVWIYWWNPNETTSDTESDLGSTPNDISPFSVDFKDGVQLIHDSVGTVYGSSSGILEDETTYYWLVVSYNYDGEIVQSSYVYRFDVRFNPVSS